MEAQLSGIWNEARAFHVDSLAEHERKHATHVANPEELTERANGLKAEYRKHGLVVLLEKIHPLLVQLRSFSPIINTLVQSHPEIAALVWGTIHLIVEASPSETPLLWEIKLAARHENTLESIDCSFETFERSLPRFYSYIKEYATLNIADRLKDALVQYHVEVIGQYDDSVGFLQCQPLRNILLCSRTARSFDSRSVSRIEKLRGLTSWVDREACLVRERVKDQAIKDYHNQILRITKPMEINANHLPYNNIPYNRNLAFRCRAEQLAVISSQLSGQNRNAGLAHVALFGLGGIGKTQIALEYAYRHFQDYMAIFWINAETTLKLAESFSAQAIALGLGEGDSLQQHDQLREIFKRWLSDYGKNGLRQNWSTPRTVEVDSGLGKTGDPIPWLMVIDGVEDVPTLEHYWPKGALGSIILTTQNPEIAKKYSPCPLKVPVFTRKESEELLFSLNSSAEQNGCLERDAVTRIADGFGDLPLALNLVGSYANSVACCYHNFIQNYGESEREFLFGGVVNHLGNLQIYQKSVDTTWTLGLQNAKPNARVLMETLAFLDKDGLPLAFFGAIPTERKLYNGPSTEFPDLAECLAKTLEDHQLLDQAIASLLERSLVSRSQSSNSLACHTLVKEAILNSMDHAHRRKTFNRTIFTLNARFPSLEHGIPLLEQWKTCERYHAHVSSLLQVYRRWRDSLGFPILLCEIVRRCAWYLFERGSFHESDEMLDTACEILERAATYKEHPGYHRIYIDRLVADLYQIRGSIEYETNQPGHGMSLLTKSKHLRQLVINDDHSYENDRYELAVTNANIALAMMAENQAQGALTWIEELLDYGAEYVSRDIWTANLSNLYWLLGDYEKSLATSQQSFDLTVKAHGINSLRMATVHFNTGNAYLALRQTDEAFESFSDCLRTCRARMPHHYKTGFACHKLGVMMRERGDLDSSAIMLQEAFQILQIASVEVGAQLRTAFVLSEVLMAKGENEDAQELRRETMDQLRNAIDEELESVEINEAFFDRFVLFCHR